MEEGNEPKAIPTTRRTVRNHSLPASHASHGRTRPRADKKAKKEFVFKGKVVKVDANAKTVVVINDYIPGWTKAVTGIYTVDNPEVLKTLEPGVTTQPTNHGGMIETRAESRICTGT